MNKIPIAEGQFEGNLKQYTQIYKINYMPKEKELSPKVELAVIMSKGDGTLDKEYSSIRFVSLPQIKSIIIGLIKSYFFFGKQIKEINTANYQYRLNKFWSDVLKALKQK